MCADVSMCIILKGCLSSVVLGLKDKILLCALGFKKRYGYKACLKTICYVPWVISILFGAKSTFPSVSP